MGASAFQRPGRQSTRLARPVLPNARGAQREGAGDDGAPPPDIDYNGTTKDFANNKNKKRCPTASSSPPATSAARPAPTTGGATQSWDNFAWNR